MSKPKDEASLNQQVEDLRERMRMLQNDRKANIEVLESNKSANKEEIRRLRDENKEYRQKYAMLQKTTAMDSEKNEQKHIESEVERLRRVHDEYKVRATRQKKDLELLKDSVKDLELDSQRPHMEDNEYTRNIRALENKLDKAMIKYNEAQSIRKTYEQIVRRLNEERVGFDNQLAAIERTLSAKQRDYEELLLLSGDSNHARETALVELERVRAGYEEERKQREKELREKHQVVQLRRQMLDRMKQREKMRHQLTGSSKPDSPSQAAMNSMSQKTIAIEKIENRNKVDIFENAFRKIKEATGVSDVNEVIQKIVSQESTTENLIAVTRENQGKIEALNELKKKIKAHCDELKYSGVGGGQHRKMVDSFEDRLSNSATRLERSRLKYERLSKVIISVKAGIGHLQDKLESFRDEIGGKSYATTDDSIAEILRECELCFNTLTKRIRAGEDESKRTSSLNIRKSRSNDNNNNVDNNYNNDNDALINLENEETASKINTLRPYNQRIDLTFDDNGGGAGIIYGVGNNIYDENDNSLDGDDEELTRDKVKRASTQILLSMDKKKKKPKKKNTNDKNDDDSVASFSKTK
eukprot:gene11317-15180_t